MQWHIPLWNPYQMCGVPYLAVLQGAVFYPPVLLFSIFPPLTAYSAYLILHILLGGFFILIFCRYLKISWIASMAAAIAFMFCNNTVEKIFGTAFLATSIYLPLMLIFVMRIFETNKLRWVLALALSFVIPLFAGWIQTLVYSGYVLASFSIAFSLRSYFRGGIPTSKILRGFPLLLLSGVIFSLLTAIQTFPVIELGLQSTRSFQELSEEMVTINNTACYGLYRIIFDMVNAKGGALPYYLYMGMLPLLLSIVSLFDRRLRFYALFLWTAAIFSLVFSMGPQVHLFSLASRLPLMSMFRAPSRILFIYAFAISALCGIGLDSLMQGIVSLKKKQRDSLLLIVLFGSFAALSLVYVWPETDVRKTNSIALLCAASRWKFYLLALVLLLVISLLLHVSNKTVALLVGLGCIAVIFFDLFKVEYYYYFLPKWQPPLYERRQQAIQTLCSLTKNDNSRAFIVSDWGDFSYCIKRGQVSNFPLINDYENMNPVIYNDFSNYLFGRSSRREREFFWGWYNLDAKLVHPKLLNYMSTKYILIDRAYLKSNKGYVAENYRKIQESCVRIYEDDTSEIFLNPAALPRAYIVGKYRVEADGEKALALLASEEFSAAEEVILSDEPKSKDGRLSCSNSRTMIEKSEPECITISAELDGDGLLVLTDQFYGGWQASIDGSPTDILRANYLFRCISVPAGTHKIVFTYRPKSFLFGRMISLTTIICIAAVALTRIFMKRRSDLLAAKAVVTDSSGADSPKTAAAAELLH